ncbi:hypothetical protein Pmar_PMAR022575 [Perkinsus marinus ATCC 50983]|uniref:subtilisin n=1 Tax=Perkinsus marinus (strain ATCC 50983 / TXsc) TaxID=423536 RepID=C5KFH9_PERM5|nr:hypothetical protein Pmar_PMAR022575 [Perkinsus marinus ATCC 50983]EER16728.1 hypothetical protein Pmar_PMAR022575 [Perkinsus marinus ATCC 50983]|eukprot:XP_002784932.1 hypothetical protein Pmar_PMAR022575 [Perkinsus marinus ATCC 50983]
MQWHSRSKICFNTINTFGVGRLCHCPKICLYTINSFGWGGYATAPRYAFIQSIPSAIGGNGVDSDHPDLINYFWRGPADASIGYNFADDCSDVPSTLEHHGTHCTGIAATKTNNKIGIAGVANTNGPVPNVELMILPPCLPLSNELTSKKLRMYAAALLMCFLFEIQKRFE